MKFGVEDITQEVSKTQQLFLEIMPRNDLIRLLSSFQIFSKSKLREYD